MPENIIATPDCMTRLKAFKTGLEELCAKHQLSIRPNTIVEEQAIYILDNLDERPAAEQEDWPYVADFREVNQKGVRGFEITSKSEQSATLWICSADIKDYGEARITTGKSRREVLEDLHDFVVISAAEDEIADSVRSVEIDGLSDEFKRSFAAALDRKKDAVKACFFHFYQQFLIDQPEG